MDGVTDGYNATVFAYGATGAGKTHTMLGRIGSPGVFHYAFKGLYAKTEELRRDKEFTITMSFIEIYNEVLKDLLTDLDEDDAPNLDIREDPIRGVFVAGVEEVSVFSPE